MPPAAVNPFCGLRKASFLVMQPARSCPWRHPLSRISDAAFKRILVTGGAGFLGSHLCERLVARRATTSSASTISSPARSRNVAHLLGKPNFELIRHDVTLPILLEVDEIYNLACPASPGHYQYNPIKTMKTSVHRRDQHAGHGQAHAGARSCRPRPAKSTATPRCIRSRRATGATSIRSARAPATTRASAPPRRCSSTTTARTSVNIRVVRIFNTYGPRMHPYDGRVVSNFIVQALRGEDITIFGDGTQTRSFCYVDDLIEGIIRMMNGARRFHRPGEPRQPGRVHDPRARRAGDRADRLEVEARPSAAAGRRSDASASPTSRWPRRSSAGSRRSPSKRPEENDRVFPSSSRGVKTRSVRRLNHFDKALVTTTIASIIPACGVEGNR